MLLLLSLACHQTEGPLGLSWSVDDHPIVTGKRISVELASAAPVELSCVSRDDARDEHLLRVASASDSHELNLSGLLASSTYDCELYAEDELGDWGRGSFRLGTSRLPSGLELGVVTGDSTAISGAWTVLNPFEDGKETNDQWVTVVDPEGEIRWYYPIADELGSVDVSVYDGRLLVGGGNDTSGGPVLMEQDQTVVYTQPFPSTGGEYHHDVEMTPSGLIGGLITKQGDGYLAFGIEVADPARDGELVWTWDSDDAVAAGTLPSGAGDAYHANALELVEDDTGELIGAYVNVRNLDRFLYIDRASGEITWQLNQFNWTVAGGGSDWWHLVHDTHFEGPVGAPDRVLLYDNGYRKPGEVSRALQIELDQEAQHASYSWSWTRDDWQEQAWGGTDWLEEDRVPIAIGHCNTCEDSDPDNRSAVLEVDQLSDEVVWSYAFEEEVVGLYRAERVDGCGLFSSLRWCPELASE